MSDDKKQSFYVLVIGLKQTMSTMGYSASPITPQIYFVKASSLASILKPSSGLLVAA